MQWFTVSDQHLPSCPEWRRIFGINKDGEVFVPAAMAGSDMEDMVALCAAGNIQPIIFHLDHYYVPGIWLKTAFPKNRHLIAAIEAQAYLTQIKPFEKGRAP